MADLLIVCLLDRSHRRESIRSMISEARKLDCSGRRAIHIGGSALVSTASLQTFAAAFRLHNMTKTRSQEFGQSCQDFQLCKADHQNN